MTASEVQRLKELKQENNKVKRLLAESPSIMGFAGALQAKDGVDVGKIQNLRRWLMVSRTLAHLESRTRHHSTTER